MPLLNMQIFLYSCPQTLTRTRVKGTDCILSVCVRTAIICLLVFVLAR